MPSKHPAIREPAIRTIAMPADINPAGDIFGGWLMAQVGLAAGNAAARRARGRCATVAVDGMVFHEAVKVGDEVTVHAELLSVGRTSMRFEVAAWRRAPVGRPAVQSALTSIRCRLARPAFGSRSRSTPARTRASIPEGSTASDSAKLRS
jgi:acyl-CoA thioesterase YciA